ncbi:MAG: DUF5060 domain-containing protein [Planctomycetaceae bacterium]
MISAFIIALVSVVPAENTTAPIVGDDIVFQEKDGFLAVEAEHFFKQEKTDKRAWYLTTTKSAPKLTPDADPEHSAGASGGAYLEILPDSRRNHDEKLIHGENFQNKPGLMAILHYKVHVETPGRYYIWARTHSTGTEDNGLHVGIDGTWPASGQRMQWTAKNQWFWDSKQRTNKVHTGVPGQLFLDIIEAGEHIISFSMREDGFEFDRWLMTSDKAFKRPAGVGPKSLVRAGKLPKPFPFVKSSRQEMVAKKRVSKEPLVMPRGEDGNGTVFMSGRLQQWNNTILNLAGPFAHENDNKPNPFTDYRFEVRFTHESGTPNYVVPGYFAADGKAANSSAKSGTIWRAHLSPDKPGHWKYQITFHQGKHAAVDAKADQTPVEKYHGRSGQFIVGAQRGKPGRAFHTRGRLQYVGKHYLQFAGTGEYFIKAGSDAPETLLAYTDFDDTIQRKKSVPLKTWQPHVADWKRGNPTWKNGKGKGLIGALNYLSDKGCNAFSFLPYNAGGDGDNIWPFVSRDDKFHYDCSKLDQWGIVFSHAQRRGLYLHFKLQENEMDDNRNGNKRKPGKVPTSLDGGKLGAERKLYLRELIARYGHHLALNWNLGEENTQSPEEQRDMAKFIRDTDAYKHNVVIHTFPDQQDEVYSKLTGDQSVLTGASLQNHWDAAHRRTLKWVRESAEAGRPWVVCNDEQGSASMGVPPDPGYKGFDGIGGKGEKKQYTLDDVRKHTLWGTLMAGGAGVEYYFGYKLPENDLKCEDFRSRDRSWDYCRIAINFFSKNKLPLDEMKCVDELVGNPKHNNSRYCFAKPGEVYLVYLPNGGEAKLDLKNQSGGFTISWFNPRKGGKLVETATVTGGQEVKLGEPPSDTDKDWLAIVRKK